MQARIHSYTGFVKYPNGHSDLQRQGAQILGNEAAVAHPAYAG
jgi:hypothetical protein